MNETEFYFGNCAIQTCVDIAKREVAKEPASFSFDDYIELVIERLRYLQKVIND